MTKTVFGWSDGGSGCEYYRLSVPLNYLQEQGLIRRKVGGHFQTVPNPLNPKLTPNLPDVVIGQRINRAEPAELWQMLDEGRLGKRPRLIYEIDDDLFNVAPSNPVHGHFAKRETQRIILDCMARADVVTVSTEPLAEIVERELSQYMSARPWLVPMIEVIPNALPDIAYRHTNKPVRHDKTVIGWAGSSTHEEDFDELGDHLARFLRRNPHVQLHIICQTLFPSLKRVPPGQLTHTLWVRPMEAYYAALDLFDIGIIPLRPSVFNRSKSDLKFLEYAARRIPVITSECGPYEVHAQNSLAWGVVGPAWDMALKMAASMGTNTTAAFNYAWSRRVDTVADKWMEVITSD